MESQKISQALSQSDLSDWRPSNMIGNSRAMQEVYKSIQQVAYSNTTVLIRGESGVGKELVAQAIHDLSSKKDGVHVKFNCAALPDSIIESELFGHEKGSFTGAAVMRKGRFEVADGGTLFIDEIGDISPSVQVKLLRVLQEKEFERVGGHTPVKCNVRIIAATSRDLDIMMENEEFRMDLFYRLNVFPIYVPALRERRADILQLADFFVEKYSSLNMKSIYRISTAAIDLLTSYHWPGNVRELENCVERAVLVCQGDSILANHLPPSLQKNESPEEKVSGNLQSMLDALELEMLVSTLKETNGNMSKAAISLGITERQMGLRVKKYKIETKRFKRGHVSVIE
ncbi:MAG: sigma-54-dependent Fis family transcriptional regulator [Planctomycetes bacterium]|nr:sigma-54-dependent Fis family transcriptional regulator [Planctomycetota bacterium]